MRGWIVVKVYADEGISGSKGRDKRPAFDAMLTDGRRHRFDVLMFWSVDRLGRSTATVSAALVELEHAGVAVYADKEGMDATTPHGRAMLQMAAVFAERERGMIRERVKAGLDRAKAAGRKLGRKRIPEAQEAAIAAALASGAGILKVARQIGIGSGTVQRVRRAMAQQPAGESAALATTRRSRAR